MKKITILIAVLTLCFSPVNAQSPTIFDWDTAPVDNGSDVTETVDGITVTVDGIIGTEDLTFSSIGGLLGSSGNVVINGPNSPTSATSITFTFSEAVDVNSILAMEGLSSNMDYTFTPTGGSNATEIVSLIAGTATANLNWTGVTSFTVTSSGSWFAFDDLSVSPNTLDVNDVYTSPKAKVYPNPVDNILNIKNVTDLKSIDLYNSVGQLVLQSKSNRIDVSHLSKGMYFLKINSAQGSETKRIIKK